MDYPNIGFNGENFFAQVNMKPGAGNLALWLQQFKCTVGDSDIIISIKGQVLGC